MGNVQIENLFKKLKNNVQLNQSFLNKLKHVQALNITSTDANQKVENAWNELYQFALTVEIGFTLEELKNSCVMLSESELDGVSAGLGFNEGQSIGKLFKDIFKSF